MRVRLLDDFPEPPPEGDPRLIGQADRTHLVPLVHAVLADPDGNVAFPRVRPDLALEQACAIWEAALYVARFLLGWADPGKGFSWWYQNGCPTEDLRLALLNAVWNERGQLGLLALWAWEHPDWAMLTPEIDALESNLQRSTRPEDFAGREWLDGLRGRFPIADERREHDPYHGGTNPLHLGHADPRRSNGEWGQMVLAREREGALLFLDDCHGWYAALEHHAEGVPTRGERSWPVDVVVKPVGWLGTFRRCRDTGRWYQGKRSIHGVGCPAAPR